MSILATMASAWVIPQETLLSATPSYFNPLMSMVHSITVTYMPMFFRIFVQRGATSKGYDNVNPRVQIARLLDAAPNSAFSRLHGAHVNGLEITPVFFAAMLSGMYADIDKVRLSKYGTLFIALRSLYAVIYFYQGRALSAVRSVVFLWSLSLCANLLKESSGKIYDGKGSGDDN